MSEHKDEFLYELRETVPTELRARVKGNLGAGSAEKPRRRMWTSRSVRALAFGCFALLLFAALPQLRSVLRVDASGLSLHTSKRVKLDHDLTLTLEMWSPSYEDNFIVEDPSDPCSKPSTYEGISEEEFVALWPRPFPMPQTTIAGFEHREISVLPYRSVCANRVFSENNMGYLTELVNVHWYASANEGVAAEPFEADLVLSSLRVETDHEPSPWEGIARLFGLGYGPTTAQSADVFRGFFVNPVTEVRGHRVVVVDWYGVAAESGVEQRELYWIEDEMLHSLRTARVDGTLLSAETLISMMESAE